MRLAKRLDVLERRADTDWLAAMSDEELQAMLLDTLRQLPSSAELDAAVAANDWGSVVKLVGAMECEV